MHLQQLLFYHLSVFWIFYFVFQTLLLIFILCIFCISIKYGFPHLSRHELVLLEHFLFYFNAFYFYLITNFDSHHHHISLLSLYYYFCHYHCHYYFFIFNAFNFDFSSFYHSILSLYISNIFKF